MNTTGCPDCRYARSGGGGLPAGLVTKRLLVATRYLLFHVISMDLHFFFIGTTLPTRALSDDISMGLSPSTHAVPAFQGVTRIQVVFLFVFLYTRMHTCTHTHIRTHTQA